MGRGLTNYSLSPSRAKPPAKNSSKSTPTETHKVQKLFSFVIKKLIIRNTNWPDFLSHIVKETHAITVYRPMANVGGVVVLFKNNNIFLGSGPPRVAKIYLSILHLDW